MISLTHNDTSVGEDLTKIISESREFVSQVIDPILDVEPKLRVSPDQYSHTVKFLGSHRVPDDEMITMIRQVMAGAGEMSMYAHLPVCRYRCTFCHYPVVVGRDPREPHSYVEMILRESEIFRRAVPEARDNRVTSLYFGGGTPTLIEDDDVFRLMDHYRSYYKLTDSAEITFEGTPETLTERKIDTLLEAGVNRVSVGVQTFSDPLLALCRRDHTGEQAVLAVQRLLAARSPKVNVDLIYGLPGQKIEMFAEDVERVASMRPTSVTIYRLRIGRDDEMQRTGMSQLYKIVPVQFPSFEDVLAMQITGRRILENHGYVERPSGWFSLPGYSEQVYEDRWFYQKPLVAFGWWTYSYSKEYEYRNYASRKEYGESVARGKLPIDFGTSFCDRERQRRFLTFGLKSSFAVDLSSLEQLFAAPQLPRGDLKQPLDHLMRHGLAVQHKNLLTLTEAGKVLIEEIISQINRQNCGS
jgi:coproporphyrinogen III oxidase-like Fe-S oxidoreductase